MMTKVGSYSAYQKQYYEQKTVGKKEDEVKNEKMEATGKMEQKQVKLSDNAKALLDELKKKYGNMDFFIADYETDEEAQSYLSRGTKEYSVLIDPQSLEEMAADEATKNKYLGILDDATAQVGQLKEQLGDEAENVTNIGFSIGKDGTVSFFASLEKMSEKQKERIENSRENRKAQAKEEEKKAHKEKLENKDENHWSQNGVKKVSLQAGSIEELAEKIKNIDWNAVSLLEKTPAGNRIDYVV